VRQRARRGVDAGQPGALFARGFDDAAEAERRARAGGQGERESDRTVRGFRTVDRDDQIRETRHGHDVTRESAVKVSSRAASPKRTR
jgi:hypothetical protein